MAEAGRPEDQCDEAVEDEFGEIIKCRSGRNGFQYLVYNKHQASCQCQHLTDAIDTNLIKCSKRCCYTMGQEFMRTCLDISHM